MGRERRPAGGGDQPLVLVKWYDYTKWVLDRVDQFPKNQRWVLGTHHGSVQPEHLDAYLDEFVFRFNRRTSSSRGMLF